MYDTSIYTDWALLNLCVTCSLIRSFNLSLSLSPSHTHFHRLYFLLARSFACSLSLYLARSFFRSLSFCVELFSESACHFIKWPNRCTSRKNQDNSIRRARFSVLYAFALCAVASNTAVLCTVSLCFRISSHSFKRPTATTTKTPPHSTFTQNTTQHTVYSDAFGSRLSLVCAFDPWASFFGVFNFFCFGFSNESERNRRSHSFSILFVWLVDCFVFNFSTHTHTDTHTQTKYSHRQTDKKPTKIHAHVEI